ncbi:hypothetical protein F2Q69_00033158 [Brassica cretica]|uniref:Flavodoxin-like domain-containing protein n=1 Tax=Brassica cretica TaxID=69181 RepID=A0A8S9SCB9_BRACR|nr:hypothetical protein F2Q69_00033158 [Brassica cretica]
MSSTPMKASPFDLMSAIIKGEPVVVSDPANASAYESVAAELSSILTENRQLAMIVTTSIAVLIGCIVMFVWRRSGGSSGNSSKRVETTLKPLVIKPREDEVDDGRKKVTIFFGTQTGTAEGFAKVSCFGPKQSF